MKILAISDTHNYHRKIDFSVLKEELNGVDTIVHAGDFTSTGKLHEVENFLSWYFIQDFKYKVLIAGNHEIETDAYMIRKLCDEKGIVFLHQESKYVNGVKFFGTPYTPYFHGWAYNLKECEEEECFSQIPLDTEVLISHGPPRDILDLTFDGLNVGSVHLWNRITKMKNLKACIFGHVHEPAGRLEMDKTVFVNASYCGIPYANFSSIGKWRIIEIEQ